jgi:uncharacterized protein (TIGR02117 family)
VPQPLTLRRRGVLLALPAAAAACATRPLPPAASAAAPATEAVHLVRRDWHTDIGLAVPDLQGGLAAVATLWPGARYLVFGFGERAYLLSRHRSLADMVMALVPGPGAMLVTGLSVPPAEAFGAADTLTLRVTAEGFARLQRYLAESFEWDAEGMPHRLAEGPYLGAEFYGAALTYSAGFTCNTWAAEALAQAGLPVRVGGVLFAHQVMDQARRLAAAG